MSNDNLTKDVVFIDAYNLIYRAFHGNKSDLKSPTGVPTNAIFTIVAMLLKLPTQFSNLAYTLAVFDGGKDNFRKEIDDTYKANRKPMPDELKIQIPYIKRAFDILGYSSMQAEEVEADDVIGTLALRSCAKGFNTYIVSSDKDFRYLVRDNLMVLDTMNKIYYDHKTVLEKMGIEPKHVLDYLCLLGDDADNIIGVDKVGKTTASKLINQYGGLMGIKDNLDNIKGVVGENLKKAFNDGQIDKNLSLIQMKLDLPINLTHKELKKRPINQAEFIEFCEELNMMSFLNKNSPKY